VGEHAIYARRAGGERFGDGLDNGAAACGEGLWWPAVDEVSASDGWVADIFGGVVKPKGKLFKIGV
jgi:hypothetical protein